MHDESLVAEYLDLLSRALSFDPKLSRRVRDEVADHLHESIASAASHVDAVGQNRDAERGAIGRFGSPWELARQYAATSLGRQAKVAGFAVFLSVLCIFGTMRYRIAWYRAAHWVNGSRYAALMSVIVPIAESISLFPMMTRRPHAHLDVFGKGGSAAPSYSCELIAALSFDSASHVNCKHDGLDSSSDNRRARFNWPAY
jgi:hypothetical protein